MMAGAIALYEEALREQAAVLSLRTADGRALPLQMSRWCGRPDAADEELLRLSRSGPGRGLRPWAADRGADRAGNSSAGRGHLAGRGGSSVPGRSGRPAPLGVRPAAWAGPLGYRAARGRQYRYRRPACPGCTAVPSCWRRAASPVEAEPGDVDEELTAWFEHPDGRRGPVFPGPEWARLPCCGPLSMSACTSGAMAAQGPRVRLCGQAIFDARGKTRGATRPAPQ